MIIDCISDLHGHYPKLEGGDLLIVAGDLTRTGYSNEYDKFHGWIYKQKYNKKIVISGNHDSFLQNIPTFFKVLNGCEYLCDSGTEFEGLKIWGSPWTKSFEGMNPTCKAFTLDTEEALEEKWTNIPQDTDILITHSPPYGILDEDDCLQRCTAYHLGSRTLLKRICEIKPKLHVFGHVHEGYGQLILDWHNPPGKTQSVNASHMNEHYEPVNKPIRVIL